MMHHTSTKGHAAHTEVCWHCVGVGARRATNTSAAGAVNLFARVDRFAAMSWLTMLGALALMTVCAWVAHVRAIRAEERAARMGEQVEVWKQDAREARNDAEAFLRDHARFHHNDAILPGARWHEPVGCNTACITTTPAVLEYRDNSHGPTTLGGTLTGPSFVRMDGLVLRADGTLTLSRADGGAP